LVYLKGIHFNH